MLRRITALLAVLALGATGVALAAAPKAKPDSGTAWAGITHQVGGELVVSGDLKDKLLGRGAIVYFLKPSGSNAPGTIHVKARSITIYTAKGSLVGTGEGDQIINPDGSSGGVKNGKFALTRGTARLRGRSYRGTFTATYKSGVYTFHYKGKLR